MTATTSRSTRTPTSPLAPRRRTRRPWLVVTVREMVVKLTDRSFLLGTALTLVMIAGGIVLSTFLGGRATDYEVAVVGTEPAEVLQAARPAITDGGDTLTVHEASSPTAARAAVEDEDVDAALLHEGGFVLVGLDDVSTTLAAAVGDAVEESVMATNAALAGTSLEELTAGASLDTELLDTDAASGGAVWAMTFVFAFLFYISAITFGMQIAQSVLEEKQNRVVEILATAIPVRQLLYGKVLGNSLLAFGQIAMYALAGLVAVNVADLAVEIGWILGASGWFVVYFVAGFAALASVWAVLGSLASRTEDLQHNTGPVLGVVMVAMFAGMFAEGSWLTAASYVPVISSVAMPVRLLGEDVGLWEPIASLLLTTGAAYLLLRFGERIYQRAVMQGGTALSWRQAMRLEE